MIREGMTIADAAHEWTREMSRYPESMIRALYNADPDSWHEVTEPSSGDRVYSYDAQEGGEIIKRTKDGRFRIRLDRGENITAGKDDFELDYDTVLPMWGTLWAFGDSCDDHWLEDEDNIRLMSECGFRIYENDEWGYFFGIDGCGYDFYEAHWIPLYKVRGLRWHDPKTEKEAS